jgi:hypothetical protein
MAMRHYTDDPGRHGIERVGLITRSADGRVYLTPDPYESGEVARDRLALQRTPTGYFEVPEERLHGLSQPRQVEPHRGARGGGTEVHVMHSVDARGLRWTEVGT